MECFSPHTPDYQYRGKGRDIATMPQVSANRQVAEIGESGRATKEGVEESQGVFVLSRRLVRTVNL